MTISSTVGDENFIKMMILIFQHNLWYDEAIIMYDVCQLYMINIPTNL